MQGEIQVFFVITNYIFFIIINLNVRTSLHVSQLISQTLKLTAI